MSTTAAHDPHAHGPDDEHAHDPHLAHHFDTPEQQFSTSKLGLWLFLATEILMFGGLFVAYAVYRYNHPEVYLWAHRALDAKWGMINTIVLLASSFTMAWGVRAAQLNQKKLLQLMLVLTFFGGVIFMCIKAVEYKTKWEHHLFPGEFNALNEQFKAPKGQDAAEIKAHTIYTVEHHGKESHGEGDPQATDKAHSNDGHSGDSSAPESAPPTGVHGPTQHGAASGPAHIQDNAPNAEANAHPNVATGGGHDQPATSQPVQRSAKVVPIGTLAPVDGNAGTPDAANIAPPAFSAAGTNREADVAPVHQWTTYAEMEPTDRAQLNTFFSIYFMMTGLHGIHVLLGMGLMVWLFLRASAGAFSSSYFTPVDLCGLYWHLVDLIWIFLFPLLYLIH